MHCVVDSNDPAPPLPLASIRQYFLSSHVSRFVLCRYDHACRILTYVVLYPFVLRGSLFASFAEGVHAQSRNMYT